MDSATFRTMSRRSDELLPELHTVAGAFDRLK